jgi:dihydrodipicolinate synthase/N-acetylneuraminate lyase
MKGVHAAIVTHFDADLGIDHDAVAAQVQRLIEGGVHGIVPNGTVGEGGSLSREERRAVIETVVDAAGGRVPVCAGVSAATAQQAATFARDAQSAGADGVMALPPLLYRADPRELLEFFGEVARAADLPMMIYNNPIASGTDMTPELLAQIVRAVPAVSSLKETSGDARRIAELVNVCPEADVMVGGDDWALEGFCAGASGWISGVAVVFPAQGVRLWDLCAAGELDAARELYGELLPLGRLDMTPKLVQYFKAALDELGIGGGPCRPPRLALTDDELVVLRQAVAHASSAPVRGG